MQKWLIPLAILALLSACASSSPLPFHESFDDARNGWTLAQSKQADIDIASGQLRVAVKLSDSLAWSVAAGKVFDDFTLDVDATPLAGPDDNDYGVVVRHVDDQNFYRFEISSDGYYNAQKRENGQWHKLTTDWVESSAIRQGAATNHLRVVCAGATLTFYVNQIGLVQVTDYSFKRGAVGVLAGTLAEPGVQVAFDNLVVSK